MQAPFLRGDLQSHNFKPGPWCVADVSLFETLTERVLEPCMYNDWHEHWMDDDDERVLKTTQLVQDTEDCL